MAIVFAENFEWGDTAVLANRYTVIGAPTVTTKAGMFGRCLRLANSPVDGNQGLIYSDGVSRTQGLVSFAYQTAGHYSATNLRFFAARAGTTYQVGLRKDGDGRISIVRNTTVIASTPNVVFTQNDRRYRIEFGFEIHASTGTVRLDVDGVTLISLTGQNTLNTAANYDQFLFTNWSTESFFDDVLFDTSKTAFRGDWSGRSIYPSADVSGYSTPSTGSRWSNIDNSPISAAAYNTFPAAGQDLYALTDLSNPPTTIHAVASLYRALKTDSGTATFRTRLNSGGVYADGSTKNLATNPLLYQDVFELDPQGNVPWVAASIDALQLAAERMS